MALGDVIRDNSDWLVFFGIFIVINIIIIWSSNSRTKSRVIVSFLLNLSLLLILILPVPYNYLGIIILIGLLLILLNGNWNSGISASITDVLFINQDSSAWQEQSVNHDSMANVNSQVEDEEI